MSNQIVLFLLLASSSSNQSAAAIACGKEKPASQEEDDERKGKWWMGLGWFLEGEAQPSPAQPKPSSSSSNTTYQPTGLRSCAPVAVSLSSRLLPSPFWLAATAAAAGEKRERMADALDMPLDDLISKNKNKNKQHNQRPRGAGGPAPTAPRRRFNTRAAAAPYHHHRTTSSFQAHARPMAYGYGAQPPMSALDTPTKLYISNLDYAVSNDDIKELFSDVGDIKRFSINYDRSGRSKGTAEVVFSRRSDALAAVKRYNNVQLDGKPMKIEIIGTNIEAPPVATLAFNPPAANFNLPFKSGPGRGGAGGWPRGRGGFGGRGRGRGHGGRGQGRGGQGRGGRGDQQVSAKDLDADLDKYHAEAMQIS
ncbi:THO complex subunit 4B-like [Phragmites australis]|uniref:THO complex subunit 4B-like n=1 Tax=Phragmites australis TaxID=29695 RepID=UPI002D7A1DA8|nr:THO complex subunit 4B-like [Phragmites australis]